MVRDSRWIDPAPLEVARPRLPWWTLLPGWVKLVLSPVVAVGLTCWVLWRVGRTVYRYPLCLALLAVGWWSYSGLGAWWFGALLALVLTVGLVWWWFAPASFERYALPQIRTETRRLVVYAWGWRTAMRLSELTKDKRGKEYRPVLGRVRAEGWRDVVRVKMVRGQAPEQWSNGLLGWRTRSRLRPVGCGWSSPGGWSWTSSTPTHWPARYRHLRRSMRLSGWICGGW